MEVYILQYCQVLIKFQDRVHTIVGDNPEESCSLDPQRTCKHVTKLVPSLKEVEKCFDVPKEVCVRSEVNPRVVKFPVVKKWCYVVACPEECVEVRVVVTLSVTRCCLFRQQRRVSVQATARSMR